MPNQLLVRLVQATNLRDAAHFGVQDPYVSVTFGDELKRSKVCKGGGVSPKWEETITFDVFDHNVTTLVLTVETKKFFVVGELIGTAEISLTEIYQTGNFNKKIPLITKDERQRGEIEVVVKYGDLLGSMEEDDVVGDITNVQQIPRRLNPRPPMLATVSGSSMSSSGHGSRDQPGFPDLGATSPASIPEAMVTRASAPSSVASPHALISSPHHPPVHERAPSHPPPVAHQQPEATIFSAPPQAVAYPTIVQITPPVYPLTSSACNNFASQDSMRDSEKGTSSEDFGSLTDGMIRSISLDSTPSDAQMVAAERQKNFRSRLEALRNETGRPNVKEENEAEQDGVVHDQGFYPEVRYEEPPATPMYL